MKLKGKVAIITGAGQGIGLGIARAYAKEGANLALNIYGKNQEERDSIINELKQYDVDVIATEDDITKESSVQELVNKTIERYGKIDILVNNAGISKFGGFMDLTPEEWTNIIDVNVKGVYYTTRAVLPEMIERNTGDIINISSTAGQKGAPVTSAYSASKAAVIGLSESLMLEVRKKNIRVVTLTPSTVATDMAVELNLTDGNPEKVMQPEDLAELIVAQLKLHPRVVLKHAGLWSTNP